MLTKETSELMSVHDVQFHMENNWIFPSGRLPAIRVTWYPEVGNNCLEVDVLLEDQRVINECFAGIGSGQQAMNDALQNFCANSFHVLLAAFWGVNDPNQVVMEDWNLQGRSYTAFIGNFGTRASAGVNPQIPDGLFETIEKAIQTDSLEEDLSWFRCFFCDIAGKQTFEALKNNQAWEAGLSALKSLPWSETNGYYSVRNFLILRENVE